MRPKSSHYPFSSSFNQHSLGAHPVLLKADKKVIDSVTKRIDKIIQLCLHPRIQLRNSPPYLLDILPDISEKLKSIVSSYQGALDELFNTLYFQVFLSNLIEKCKATSKLFKEAKDLMYDERSEYRRRLTKNSLVFSHILKDLEALYPNNKFAPEAFRITKREAADWWLEHFERSPIIPWAMFRDALFRSFHVTDANHMRELQSTIDLSVNDYVSIFEFDVFVRLFQPWNNVIETWKALATMHAGYMAFMTYDEVKAVLKRFRCHPGPGSYVYRLSCTKLGQWAIGYITQDLRILQTIIQNKSLARALIDGERDGFYLYPNGTPSQSTILAPLVRNQPCAHVQVSPEQHQLYFRFGSTFELCKICTENTKNIRLEPCGHLLCKSCLLNCQGAGAGQTCPFCRMEVKSIEEVVLDPFVPPEESRSPSVGEEEGEDEEAVDIAAQLIPEQLPCASTSNAALLPIFSSSSSSSSPSNSAEDLNHRSSLQQRGDRNPSSISSRVDLDQLLEPVEGQKIIKPLGSEIPVAHAAESENLALQQQLIRQASMTDDLPLMTLEDAKELLETCERNVEIALRVWQRYMPR